MYISNTNVWADYLNETQVRLGFRLNQGLGEDSKNHG